MNGLRDQLLRRPLLTAVLYTAVGVLPLFLVSVQILQLRDDLGFGVGELAIATATFMGSAALMAGPAGSIVARVGTARGFRDGAALTIASCLVAGLAGQPWMVPVATAIGGMGNGLIQVAANLAIFDEVRGERQGLAYGAKQAAVPMASVVAGVSLPLVGLVFGWRWVFALAGLLAFILALAVPSFDGAPSRDRAEASQGRLPLALVPLALAGLFGAMAGNGLALFVVPSAVEIGITEGLAGTVLAVASVLVVVTRIAVGRLVDTRGSKGYLEMTVLASAGAAGALALVFVDSPWQYLVAMPIALLGAWGWPGIIFFTVVRSFPKVPGRASGMVLSGNLVGTLIGPVVVGLFAARGDYASAWLFASGAASLAVAGFAVANRVGRRDPVTDRAGRPEPQRNGRSMT